MTDILPIDRTQLELRKAEAATALSALHTVPCATPEQEAQFRQVMDYAHKIVKELDAEYTQLLAPVKQAYKQTESELKAEFKAPTDAFEAVKALCKEKIGAFHTEQRRLADAAKEAALLAAEAGETAACAAALAAVPVETHGSFVWEAHIIDQFQVPREWLEVSTGLVKAHCKAHAKSDYIPPVPGLAFKRVAVVRAK